MSLAAPGNCVHALAGAGEGFDTRGVLSEGAIVCFALEGFVEERVSEPLVGSLAPPAAAEDCGFAGTLPVVWAQASPAGSISAAARASHADGDVVCLACFMLASMFASDAVSGSPSRSRRNRCCRTECPAG